MAWNFINGIPLRGVNSGQSWSSYWTPRNVVLTVISGTILRITWENRSDTVETELWISIDGGTATLIATLGYGIETYDYIHDEGVLITVQLRAKIDETVLNIPTNLAAVEITDGVRLTWDDNNTEADHIQIWASINGAGYS